MKRLIITLVMLFFFAVSANGALVDNGDGTITDTDNNLMWLQDANYSMTSGYDADGFMTWNDAMTWASNLTYGEYDDWRLPYVDMGNGQVDAPCSNNSCAYDEIGHLFYSEGINVNNSGPFINTHFSTNLYFSSVLNTDYTDQVWVYYFIDGRYLHDGINYTDVSYSWAVRDIGSSVVPEPISSTLFIVGGATLGFRRFRKSNFKIGSSNIGG